MVLARAVFQAKIGKANNVVAYLKESFTDLLTDDQMASFQPRILTDISGRFDTVILETTHTSLAELEQVRQAMFEQSAASEEPSPMLDLIESGRNEYYTIEM